MNYKYKFLYKTSTMIYIYFFIIFIFQINCNENRKLQTTGSELTIKINGVGIQPIIYKNFNGGLPNKVFCNGLEVETIEGYQINIPTNLSTVKLVWNTKLNTCFNMFVFLDNIIEVDLSNFELNSAYSSGYVMGGMFSYCKNLEKVTMSNKIDTTKIINVVAMFDHSTSLTSVDMSNFRVSLITSTEKMFNYCEKLESLDLSKFDTSRVTTMRLMFYRCFELKHLNIENFITENVEDMYGMFYYCRSLISLDLSHFRTPKVSNMLDMFHNCLSLQYLDISHFDTSLVTTFKKMFCGCKH